MDYLIIQSKKDLKHSKFFVISSSGNINSNSNSKLDKNNNIILDDTKYNSESNDIKEKTAEEPQITVINNDINVKKADKNGKLDKNAIPNGPYVIDSNVELVNKSINNNLFNFVEADAGFTSPNVLNGYNDVFSNQNLNFLLSNGLNFNNNNIMTNNPYLYLQNYYYFCQPMVSFYNTTMPNLNNISFNYNSMPDLYNNNSINYNNNYNFCMNQNKDL